MLTQVIYVKSTATPPIWTFRGPFTDNPAPLSGETPVTITATQYATLNSARKAIAIDMQNTMLALIAANIS